MKTETIVLSFPKNFLIILQIVFLCGLSCIHSLIPLSKLSFTQRMLLECVPCTSHGGTVMENRDVPRGAQNLDWEAGKSVSCHAVVETVLS